jgi:hypothetical protein
MTTIIHHLIQSIRGAAVYNSEVQVAPACILWPDADRQWQSVIPRLQPEMPELLVLGDYDPENRTGPAIWLRCAIAGKIESVPVLDGPPPVLYLPGVGRSDLRAVASCPEPLKPLAELQFRGAIWSQVNARDWTLFAFLKSDGGGLNLDVAGDGKSKNALRLALPRLVDEPVDFLKGKHLDKDFFNSLLLGGDPVKDLLQWLDRGDAFKESREAEWPAFVEVCESQFGFNPDNEGLLSGAERLASRKGPWQTIWDRFSEAPGRYRNIPDQIRKCTMPLDLFQDAESHGGWPQWNAQREADLRRTLTEMADQPAHKARARMAELEQTHEARRELVWAELGESPLVRALTHLTTLAGITETPLAAGTVRDLQAGFAQFGWKADDAVTRALACVTRNEDYEAVAAAVRCLYLPWIAASAHHLQAAADGSGYPGRTALTHQEMECPAGTCFLFVDGLRYDAARRLIDRLSEMGYDAAGTARWAALPSVTATGKPAVSPVRHLLEGDEAPVEFEPVVSGTGQSLKGGQVFKKLLKSAGWQILSGWDLGDPAGRGWAESGNLDAEGHNHGWKLAQSLDSILEEIADRVRHLIDGGWRAVRIVTDHGWLLMPGGLPKADLPGQLAESKWGRCAVIKPGAAVAEPRFPWYWNPHQAFALAAGVASFRKGLQYAHGGLSLQECLVMEITVTADPDASENAAAVEITDIVWKGMRCKLAAEGETDGLFMDIRKQPGNPETSLVMGVKPVKKDGTASVVVEDDALDGTAGFIVLMDKEGGLAAQVETVIGGGKQ